MVASVRGTRGFVVAAVMASLFMVAIEATIVSTAMPLIVADLGGMHLYSWAFSGFLLAQTAATVVFGKLSDLYGRKPIVLAGITIFIVGLLLGGLAWSMPSLIAFRVVQGIGAGAVQPVAMTVVADLFPARERGKVQGYLASVWALAGVAGPLAGAAIIARLSWPWIFWITIPVGLAAAALYVVWLRDDVAHQAPSIDYGGAALFTISIGAFMFALSGIGTEHGRAVAIAVAVCVVASWIFVWHERRVPDPVVSFELWRRRALATANGVSMLGTMTVMGLTAFLPMYVQTVMQRTPLVAGFALTMMMVGWPLGATVCAKVFPRWGLRNLLVGGAALQPLGALCFVALTPESSPVLAGVGSAVMGFGMGLLIVCSFVLIQEASAAHERGSATASNLFSRNLGSALGATVFGVVVNFGLAGAPGGGGVTAEDLQRLLDGGGRGLAGNAGLLATLHVSLHTMFLAMFAVSIVTVIVALFVPDQWFRRPQRGVRSLSGTGASR